MGDVLPTPKGDTDKERGARRLLKKRMRRLRRREWKQRGEDAPVRVREMTKYHW